jgi:two-component system, chemotaxis family, CheB/CheR fusion protein
VAVDRSFPVVGVGASAGGYEAFVSLLEGLPATLGAAIVFVQHLDPTHESMLVTLLSRVTGIPVEEAKNGTAVKPGRIYVAPPGATVVISNGVLGVAPSKTPRHLRMPVDAFLRSLAQDRGNAAIGVILSGTGTDGTLGLWQIKEDGGICFVQDPDTAKFSGMPQSAIAETAVDFTLPPGGIARELVRLADHPYVSPAATPEDAPSAQPADEARLGRILALLKTVSGVDFASYKQTTIIRRILRRMTLLDKDDLAEYASYCEEHREELVALYHDLLIKVTKFFREPESFTILKQKVFPALFENRPSDRPFRIWVPGCSSGEEPYSIAIVLFEFLAERKLPTPVIQIFATDVDESVLEKARSGAYVDNIAADISPERLRQFFTHADHKYTIAKQVRDVCTFARHNLLTDPPFSNLDLISCHNLFIYLDLPAQRRVIPGLHYALRPDGFLTLSSAESITADELFALVDAKYKVYMRRGAAVRTPLHAQSHLAPAVPLFGKIDHPRATPGEAGRGGYRGAVDLDRETDRTLLEFYSPVGVLVDEKLDILQYRGDTSRYLAPAPGRASLNLLNMAREGLLGDLRAAVEEAKASQQAATREGVPVTLDGTLLDVTIRVFPAQQAPSSVGHHMVLF